MSGVVVLTGAGVSADSGVKTFRDHGGLWEGLSVEEVATPEGWAADPARVWRFYQGRRKGLGGVEPNAAHTALVRLEQALRDRGVPFLLVTQNVDDLHERAGSRAMVHMHGELARLRCEACGFGVRDLEALDEDRFRPCDRCSHPRLRPDVVWFGEVPFHLERIEAALGTCTHFLALGTSGVVYPAAMMLAVARAAGARTWVSALEAPDNLDPRDEFRAGRAAEVVPGLVGEVLGEVLGEG